MYKSPYMELILGFYRIWGGVNNESLGHVDPRNHVTGAKNNSHFHLYRYVPILLCYVLVLLYYVPVLLYYVPVLLYYSTRYVRAPVFSVFRPQPTM